MIRWLGPAVFVALALSVVALAFVVSQRPALITLTIGDVGETP
mgnify:CR=1 FL=1